MVICFMAKSATIARDYLKKITEELENSSLSKTPITTLFPSGPRNQTLSALLHDNDSTEKHLYLIGPGQLKPVNRRKLAGRYFLAQSLVIVVSSLSKNETYENVRKKSYWTSSNYPDNRVLGVEIIEGVYKIQPKARARWRGITEEEVRAAENAPCPSEKIQYIIKGILYDN
jgi:hypothetical protein